jgi:hypothetical protein
MLRQFLYLDRSLVREFLSQIEGGVFDESRETTSETGSRGGHAKIGSAGLGVGLERSRAKDAQSEAVIKQTSASEFERLHLSLEEQGLLIYDAIDEDLTTLPIRRKDIIEVDARLKVSGLHTMLDVMSKLGNLLPLMQKFDAAVELDADTLEAMQAIGTLNGSDRPIPVIATVPGETHLEIALELTPGAAHTIDWDLEATVLLKVQRILRPGDREVVGDLFGGLLSVLPQEERRKAIEGLETDDLRSLGIGQSEVTYPALVGTPIAIYR